MQDQVIHLDAAEVLASLGHAVVVTDSTGHVVSWNPAAEQLYGWTASEAIGSHARTLYVPDMPDPIADDVAQALRDRTAWSGGLLVRRRDGARFVALLTAAGVYRDDQFVGVVSTSINIGPAARPLLERSTDAALMLRADAIVSYASPAVRELFGWDHDALLGNTILPLIHEVDRLELAEFLDRVVTRPGAHPPVELRVKVDTGWIWAEAALTNLLDDPTVRGVVCNLRPSTHRARQEAAEEQVRQLQTALNTRIVIEQAKGHLGGRHGLTPDEAFARIRRYARGHHLSVHQVCVGVLAGEIRMNPDPEAASSDQQSGSGRAE